MINSKQKMLLFAIIEAQDENFIPQIIDGKVFGNLLSFIKKTFNNDCEKLQSLGLIKIYRKSEIASDQSKSEIIMSLNEYFIINLNGMIKNDFITKVDN